jgi:hypothetical protein
MMPRLESMEGQTPLKLLGAHTIEAKEDDRATVDPLIKGLMDRLPKPDEIWPLDDRAKWFRAAANIFSLSIGLVMARSWRSVSFWSNRRPPTPRDNRITPRGNKKG